MKVEGWRGGRAWREPDGTLTYHIRKTIGGHTYERSTGCRSLAAAIVHLEKFEKDPDRYRPEGDPAEAPIYLDADPDAEGVPKLVREFLKWSLRGKENTEAWVGKQRNALAWWATELRGVNLRRATLVDHIDPALDKATDRGTRIRVLKAFYGWLRKEKHVLRAADDPTFGTLPAPKARPAQEKRSKAIPRDHIFLVVEHLTSPWREALTVQAGTGWHTTEVLRFAAGGTIEPMPKTVAAENGAAGVLVCPLHKSGVPHRTAVTAEVLKAAKTLLKHGSFSREWYDRAVKAACKAVKRPDGKIGIPAFTPAMMRHTTATLAVEVTGNLAAVSSFLGHRSIATTKKFYSSLAVSPKIPTTI
ncbi:MAG: site-specific integrase [Deltaproteobacteria bacterium]|nr:site-specific integrase [Deltaproteobacteria bacterium]